MGRRCQRALRKHAMPKVATRTVCGLLVALLSGCGDSGTQPELPPPPVAYVQGTVTTLDGQPAVGATVEVDWPGLSKSSKVGGDGSFAVPLDTLPEGIGSLAVHPTTSASLPAWIPLPADPITARHAIVLLPSTWTVKKGVHAGETVDIHPAEAADDSVMPSYWGFQFPFTQEGRVQTVTDSTLWTAALVTWPAGMLPVPVAIDRVGGDVTPDDSAALWTGLHDLEDALGRSLFTPSRLEDLPPQEDVGTVPGAVVVRLDSTLVLLRGRSAPSGLSPVWFWSADVSDWSGTQVASMTAASLDASEALISIRDEAALHDPALVMHEAMHALGLGHGCSWMSLQTYCESLKTDAPTAEDVAYLELLEAAREAERTAAASVAILPAVWGERVITLGLTPLP